MKTCRKCKQERDLALFKLSEKVFTIQNETKVYKRANICNICKEETKLKNRLAIYGLSIQQYKDLLKDQDYCCAICNAPWSLKTFSNMLMVDHDHKTGKVRGLLCHTCNIGLGQFEDNPNLLKRAISYLEK